MLSDIAASPASETAPPSSRGPTPFALAAGPFVAGRLRVLSFRGREAVSRPFRFEVGIAVGDADQHDLEPALLGQPASLEMHVSGGEPRVVCGIIAAVTAQAAFEQDRHAFRVRLVPRLWLLGKRTTSRVFQNKTVPQIVDAVLGAAGMPRRWALVEKYARRVYSVQYQETDLAFITRLLAEEGIFYGFEHGAEETVVFGDSAHLYEPIAGDPELAYRYEHGSDGLVPAEHHVGRFALRRAIKPGAVIQRDYDFRRPRLDLRAEAKPSSAPPVEDAAADALAFEAARLVAYDHHGEDDRPDVDAGSARVRLEIAGAGDDTLKLKPRDRPESIHQLVDLLLASTGTHIGRDMQEERYHWRFLFPEEIVDGCTFTTNPDANVTWLWSWAERADGSIRNGRVHFILHKQREATDGRIVVLDMRHWFDGKCWDPYRGPERG